MPPPPKSTSLAHRLLSGLLTIGCLALGWTSVGGCGSSETPSESKPSADAAQSRRDGATDGPTSTAGNPDDNGQTAPVGDGSITAEGVLRSMVTAYKKASSYADRGSLRLIAKRTPESIDQTLKFSLALRRPDQIRMEVYQARVVSDGKQLHAAILDLPGQVVQREAPPELTLRTVYTDRVLAGALMYGGYAGPSPQLNLLLGEDPLKELLENAQEIAFEESQRIAGRDCYRVRVVRAEGTLVFWIDRETFVLRRINYPAGGDLREMLERGGTVESVSLVGEFTDARFDARIDPKAFQFEAPEDAELVKWFRPPHPAQLLGKKVPPFRFFAPDGSPIAPETLAGKVVVLNFWAVGWKPSLDNLPKLDQVRQQYQANDKVVWLVVSVNDQEMENKTLQETLTGSGAKFDLFRDLEANQVSVLGTTAVPSTFIIDARGVLQDFEFGDNPNLATALPEKLEKVLAGEDIYQALQQTYLKELEAIERAMEAVAKGEPPEAAADGQQTISIAPAEIAPSSPPKTLKLTRLWKCDGLSAPCNVLVVPSADGPPRLLAVDTWKSVAEVGLDGKLLANHAPPIEQTEFINTLRTATGSDGKRRFVAFFTGQQRFHLLDENLELLTSYPPEALENPHAGIADVQLGDLDGDGTLKLYAGYWGVLGVRAASLAGKSLWSNRTAVINVQRIALSGPDAQGRRRLLCANTSDGLAILDAQGRSQGSLSLPGRFLRGIVAADLDGDGRPEWCGMAGLKPGENLAVGLDPTGKEVFSYQLPEGIHERPIEQIIPGRLTRDGPGCWLLPGPDGSIHILTAAGKPLDDFHYGASLAGLATTEINGAAALIISSSNGLEAWKVE